LQEKFGGVAVERRKTRLGRGNPVTLVISASDVAARRLQQMKLIGLAENQSSCQRPIIVSENQSLPIAMTQNKLGNIQRHTAQR
jgi:hypothetical protein